MGLVPVPEGELEDREVLVLGAAELEPIITSVALERALEQRVKRLFLPTFELWRLEGIPAYRHGATQTYVLGFPTPALDAQPALVHKALREAEDLTWVSEHPLDTSDADMARNATVIEVGENGFWQTLSSKVGKSSGSTKLDDDLSEILADLPEHLPEPAEASKAIRWRYALEAARQEPFTLRLASRGLVEGEEPEAELVALGHDLITECRDLARRSSFPTFETPGGLGVIVMAPRSAFGFYRDVAREACRHRACAVSLLGFDSNEPAFVSFEHRPSDFTARMDFMSSALPSHTIREMGRAGIVIKGSATGGLELLTTVIDILKKEIN